jgi:hypothetical protein
VSSGASQGALNWSDCPAKHRISTLTKGSGSTSSAWS